MSALGRSVVEGLGVAGYVTRGVVFCVVGAFANFARRDSYAILTKELLGLKFVKIHRSGYFRSLMGR